MSASRQRRLTLLAMCVATFMIQIDVTIVNVALPRVQTGLRTSPGVLEWVISGYALALAALIPLGGALGDRYGRKRVFVAGMALFSLASSGCALASGASTLIAFRVVQGVGGAALLALSLSIITETFPAEGRAGAIGTWAAVGGTGFGLGPVAGGLLLSVFDWPSVFWVNVPAGAAGIVLTAAAVRESRSSRARRLDRPGVTLSAAGLLALTLGLVNAAAHPWGSWPVAAPLGLGAALLAGFACWQRRTPHAMIPPALLKARSFLAASGVYLISYTAFSGMLFYVTLLYQDIFGWSALHTGLSWLLMNIPFLVMAQLTGRLERHLQAATMITLGCVTGAGGLAALSFASPTTPFTLTAAGYLLAGAGCGTLVAAISHVAMRDVPADISGAASGVVNASRQLGTSIGLAVLGSIGVNATKAAWTARVAGFPASIQARALGQAQNVAGARLETVSHSLGTAYRNPAAHAFLHGYHLAVGLAAGCLLLAALCTVLSLRQHRPAPASQAQPDNTTPSQAPHLATRFP